MCERDGQAPGGRAFISGYLAQAREILDLIDQEAISEVVAQIEEARRIGGRLFFLGSGGGAGHAGHAVCDFRKFVGIEAYSPSDNLTELTARINDDGWQAAYVGWLQSSRLRSEDLVMVISVGGGDLDRGLSLNLVEAIKYAKGVGTHVCGIVGREEGVTAALADACIVIPQVEPALITAHTEGIQSVLLHLLASHPFLSNSLPTWESTAVNRREQSV